MLFLSAGGVEGSMFTQSSIDGDQYFDIFRSASSLFLMHFSFSFSFENGASVNIFQCVSCLLRGLWWLMDFSGSFLFWFFFFLLSLKPCPGGDGQIEGLKYQKRMHHMVLHASRTSMFVIRFKQIKFHSKFNNIREYSNRPSWKFTYRHEKSRVVYFPFFIFEYFFSFTYLCLSVL